MNNATLSFKFIAEPLIVSTTINKNCPPSSIGSGKRLKAPKLMLKIANKSKKGIKPLLRESPATLAMPTGPLNDSSPMEPETILNKILKVLVIQKIV